MINAFCVLISTNPNASRPKTWTKNKWTKNEAFWYVTVIVQALRLKLEWYREKNSVIDNLAGMDGFHFITYEHFVLEKALKKSAFKDLVSLFL